MTDEYSAIEGDIATTAAYEMAELQLKNVEPEDPEESQPDSEEDTRFKRYWQTKIRFNFKREDKLALGQIEYAADQLVLSVFSEAIDAVDTFYGLLRVPEWDEKTGAQKRDENGRVVFRRDERGKYIQDLSQATGQDFQEALLHLAKSKLESSQAVANLLSEAIYAKHIYDDKWREQYDKPAEGTIDDRKAKANARTLEDKYFAYYTFVVYNRAKQFARELDNLMRIIEKIANWMSWATKE